MPQVISFHTDVPAFKPKGPRPWDHLFTMQISGDYITFGGVRELRAWCLTASDGVAAYSMEFNGSGALFDWFVETAGFSPEDARMFLDAAEQGRLVPVNLFMGKDTVKALGFKDLGKPFTPPNLF